MADIPDSSGPFTQGGTQKKKVTRDDLERWVAKSVQKEFEQHLESLIDPIVSAVLLQLGSTLDRLEQLNESNGKRFQVIESRISQLNLVDRSDNGELRNHVSQLDDYAKQLHAAFEENRRRQAEIEDMITDAETSVKYLQRTVERVNYLAEADGILLEILVPIHNWLGRWIEKKKQADQRVSRVDGKFTPTNRPYGRRKTDRR